MVYGSVACAAFCGLVLAASIVAGVFYFAAGLGAYLFFERVYHSRKGLECQKAFEAGVRSELEKRAKEIQALDLPTNKYEEQENKTYAEGLAGLYPKDPTLQDAIKTSQKLKEIVGDA